MTKTVRLEDILSTEVDDVMPIQDASAVKDVTPIKDDSPVINNIISINEISLNKNVPPIQTQTPVTPLSTVNHVLPATVATPIKDETPLKRVTTVTDRPQITFKSPKIPTNAVSASVCSQNSNKPCLSTYPVAPSHPDVSPAPTGVTSFSATPLYPQYIVTTKAMTTLAHNTPAPIISTVIETEDYDEDDGGPAHQKPKDTPLFDTHGHPPPTGCPVFREATCPMSGKSTHLPVPINRKAPSDRTLFIGVDTSVCDGDTNREWTTTVIRKSRDINNRDCCPKEAPQNIAIKVVASVDESSEVEESEIEEVIALPTWPRSIKNGTAPSKLKSTPTRHSPIKLDDPSKCKQQ